ncbi:MAG: LLM class flavin-dependent oxidoreductase [Armatimonadetes bacterium]|nr:LLM class flavin-dependent oxidoreductase [Armatimonadota bacterium]
MTRDGVRFGIGMPQVFPAGRADPEFIARFLARAEALGYHSAWVQEQIIGTVPIMEPVTLLAFAAAHTRRMLLGTAVLLTPIRNPVQLAKSLATVDHLSGGRLIAGVGLGAAGIPTYAAFGVPTERRVRRFVEGVHVMRKLWTEEQATFHGTFYRLDGISMEPKPVQKPHPPIWIGAHHPSAVRRAIRLGDGFVGAGTASTAQFRDEVGVIRRTLAEAGRDPATFPLSKRVYIAVDRDRGQAERRLVEWFAERYRGRHDAQRVAVYGNVDDCAAGLREAAAAGASLLILNPVFDEMEHLEALAEVQRRL